LTRPRILRMLGDMMITPWMDVALADTRYTTLAAAFLQYSGQRGTAKQVARLIRQFGVNGADTLARMLAERGRCGHCGSMAPFGQSCGCFDNGGQ